MEKSVVIRGALQKIGISFDFDDYENDSNYKAALLALDRIYANLLADMAFTFNVKTVFPVRAEGIEPVGGLYEYKKPGDFLGITWTNVQVYERGNKIFAPVETGLQIDYKGAWDFANLPLEYMEYITCRLALEIATPLNKTKNINLIVNVMQREYDKLESLADYGPVHNINRREVF